MHEWITAEMTNASFMNYYCWLIPKIYSDSSSVNIMFMTGSKGYLTGVKINILMVSRSSPNGYIPEVYSYKSTEGSFLGKTFKFNFGINSSTFGSESSEYYLQGLTVIDLFYSSFTTRNTSFLFSYSGG